ncbi:hypothetical protein HK101_011210 [Irineochytrium annulatum]|nr:hypothetical protein HK101_011210 [Irineochytrium annulatum]
MRTLPKSFSSSSQPAPKKTPGRRAAVAKKPVTTTPMKRAPSKRPDPPSTSHDAASSSLPSTSTRRLPRSFTKLSSKSKSQSSTPRKIAGGGGGGAMISRTKALKEFHIPPAVLDTLPHVTIQNPRCFTRPIRLYRRSTLEEHATEKPALSASKRSIAAHDTGVDERDEGDLVASRAIELHGRLEGCHQCPYPAAAPSILPFSPKPSAASRLRIAEAYVTGAGGDLDEAVRGIVESHQVESRRTREVAMGLLDASWNLDRIASALGMAVDELTGLIDCKKIIMGENEEGGEETPLPCVDNVLYESSRDTCGSVVARLERIACFVYIQMDAGFTKEELVQRLIRNAANEKALAGALDVYLTGRGCDSDLVTLFNLPVVDYIRAENDFAAIYAKLYV